MFVAHKTEDGLIQTVKEHSEQTALLCQEFAVKPLKVLLHEIGLMHDIGKYQPDFQRRINGENIRVPHALCGAHIAKKLYGQTKPLSRIMEYVIAGHHAGLHDAGSSADNPDKSTLYANLKRKTQDYSAFKNDLNLGENKMNLDEITKYILQDCVDSEKISEQIAFIIRYCFSCLTDADWLDTERFYTRNLRQTLTSNFGKCLNNVNQELEKFICTTTLQQARKNLQKQAFDKVTKNADFYLMNMPTGSGKTLCSIKFALERALISGKKRIIYIIPYNSIIDQTAEVLQNIFKENAVILRHQSTFSFEKSDLGNEQEPLLLKQATENWDAQIIITTAVQFFESVYSNKRSNLRKLHNMADSILIFDEAHLMPKNFLQPCLQAIAHITRYLNSHAIFLTATMPDFSYLLQKYTSNSIKIENLITVEDDFSYFKKCIFNNIGEFSKEQLISEAQENPSTLIIVNKRVTAKELYALAVQGKTYHLSTYMTSLDRVKVIEQVKQELCKLEQDYPNLIGVPAERRILVISTSLIEAGVDLDFSSVYRQLWGLDSILQAGGRCNREGKLKQAFVNIFQLSDGISNPLTLEQDLTQGILKEFKDISSSESIAAYYERLFEIKKDDIIKNSLGKQCVDIIDIPFASYAETFEIIDSNTISIVIPQTDHSHKLLKRLQYTGYLNIREIQSYTCSVYRHEFNALLEQGVLNDYNSGVYWLINSDYYNEHTGIVFEGEDKYF